MKRLVLGQHRLLHAVQGPGDLPTRRQLKAHVHALSMLPNTDLTAATVQYGSSLLRYMFVLCTLSRALFFCFILLYMIINLLLHTAKDRNKAQHETGQAQTAMQLAVPASSQGRTSAPRRIVWSQKRQVRQLK